MKTINEHNQIILANGENLSNEIARIATLCNCETTKSRLEGLRKLMRD